MAHVFISHSNKPEDKAFTRKVEKYLSEKGIYCWVDYKDIKSGYWAQVIMENLWSADAYILISSKNSLTSIQVQNELSHMLKKGINKFFVIHMDNYYQMQSSDVARVSYHLGNDDIQGIIVSKYETDEEAIKQLYATLPKSLTCLENNPKDFSFSDDNSELKKYSGNDERVVIPSFVTRIAKHAFINNKSVQKIVIPDGVKEIGKRAFFGCSKLSSIELGNGVWMCENDIINDTPLLEACNKDGYIILDYILLQSENDGDCTVPETVRIIASNAMDGKYEMRKLVVHDKVKYIGDEAFSYCINLEEVDISPDTKVSDTAFLGCKKYK